MSRKAISLCLFILTLQINAESLRVGQWNWRDASIKSRYRSEIKLAVDLVEKVKPDILAIEEVLDDKVVGRLADGLNGRELSYSHLTSPEVGRGTACERYAFVWNTEKVKMVGEPAFMPDPDNKISREPWLALFDVNDYVLLVFAFHASSDEEQSLIEDKEVADFFAEVENGVENTELILCGDFNQSSDRTVFHAMREVATPAIPSTTDTTVGQTFRPDDNIWVDNDLAFENPGVFRHDDEWFDGDNDEASLHLSDHYLVWVDVELPKTGVRHWEVY